MIIVAASRGAGGAGWCGGGAAGAAVMDWSDDALGICTTNATPAGGDAGGGFMGTVVADCGCVAG